MNREISNVLEQNKSSSNSKTDKYICSIEGKVDENGNIIPVNSSDNDIYNQVKLGAAQRFVFVCEYNYK